MPHFRGDEPCFSDIRAFIMSDRCPVEECRRFVSYSGEHIAWQLNAGEGLNTWGHFLAAETDYLNISTRVELFAGPGKRPLTYTVRLGRNPSRLDCNENFADFFEYLPRDQRTLFDGTVSPLSTIRTKPRIAIPILSYMMTCF